MKSENIELKQMQRLYAITWVTNDKKLCFELKKEIINDLFDLSKRNNFFVNMIDGIEMDEITRRHILSVY